MGIDYSIETCRQLKDAFDALDLYRPMRVAHYDAGIEVEYAVTPVEPGSEAVIRLLVEKFVGGGFAGQVYKVRLTGIIADGQSVEQWMNLTVGSSYAVKILIPPSTGSRLFRNFLYAVGFLGNFLVPTSVDGPATAPFAQALLVNQSFFGQLRGNQLTIQ